MSACNLNWFRTVPCPPATAPLTGAQWRAPLVATEGWAFGGADLPDSANEPEDRIP